MQTSPFVSFDLHVVKISKSTELIPLTPIKDGVGYTFRAAVRDREAILEKFRQVPLTRTVDMDEKKVCTKLVIPLCFLQHPTFNHCHRRILFCYQQVGRRPSSDRLDIAFNRPRYSRVTVARSAFRPTPLEDRPLMRIWCGAHIELNLL